MARTPTRTAAGAADASSAPVDRMLIEALERDEAEPKTGRLIVTFKEGAEEAAADYFDSHGIRAADARDFASEAATLEAASGAEAITLPEFGVAIVPGHVFADRGMSAAAETAADNAVDVVEPESFIFAEGAVHDYLRGFRRATEAIAHDLGELPDPAAAEIEEAAAAAAATWGLAACAVPQSGRSGAGIRIAVLDTGMDLLHPDFQGRSIVSETFVGQPVQDLHGHGTHCIGTACGPRTPGGTSSRYGIAYAADIFVGKVLSNSGVSVDGSVLAGMRWAIDKGCAVISMSLSGSTSPVAAYTAAGRTALNRGLLIVAAAGNQNSATRAPANSRTVLSVASVDPDLRRSSFSNFGKIDLAAPGRDVLSSLPRPRLYGTKNGTSMATPHVAGCAALWAQSSPGLRGRALWDRLLATAKPLADPPAKVGKGLVRAPA